MNVELLILVASTLLLPVILTAAEFRNRCFMLTLVSILGLTPGLPCSAEPPAGASASIMLKPDVHAHVTKVIPLDSRLVREFVHGPVDGRTDTRTSTGVVSEWSGYHGVPAVQYRAFNGNNGLHITLPEGGIDALFIRGTWEGNLFADLEGLHVPAGGEPLCTIRPLDGAFIRRFPQRVDARRLSFFYDSPDLKRTLNDVTFLRFDDGVPPRNSAHEISLGAGPKVEPDGVLAPAIAARYGDRLHVHRLTDSGEDDLDLAPGMMLQLLTPPQEVAFGVDAVTLSFEVANLEDAADLSLHVQDVLDPRREVMGVDLRLSRGGRHSVTLDHPDQVFLPPRNQWNFSPRYESSQSGAALVPPPVVWLTLHSSVQLLLRDVTVTVHCKARDQALTEAGRWRKFLLRGLFQAMSEPRPWMHLKDAGPVADQVATNPAIERYRTSLIELLETAEIARLLLPDDDIVRQYHDWIYQNIDRNKQQPPAVWPVLPDTPAWAVQVREGWRHISRIARWWLDNRLVANGELGGGINDDTDMFQVWQCLPMIETSPLGDRLKEVAARLAETAIEHTLEEGLNRHRKDALHAYEEGVNHLALCAWWFYGDPVHFERTMASARSVTGLMIETDDGRVHFGSRFMSIREAREGFGDIGRSPGDGNWAPARLLLHPLYVVGLYNKNPTVLDKFERWGRTWRNYQRRGAYVGQVDIPSGEPTIVAERPTAEAVGPVNEWLALYHITGDSTWQEPFTSAMDPDGYWGTSVQYGRMPHALVEWPDPYQAILRGRIARPEHGYAGFFLHKNRAYLKHWLETSASWFSRFPHMDTAAEQKTDRVLTYKASVPLSCYLGDAPNRNRWLNFTAVSYEGLRGEDFAGLVWDAGSDRLKLAVYSFAERPLHGVIRTWRLDHGRYRVRIGHDIDDDGWIDVPVEDRVVLLQRFAPISVTLPARQVTVVQIEQIAKLDDITQRADLALSPLDIHFTGYDEVAVTLHNIGARGGHNVRVNHMRGGRAIASQTVERLDAPLDLHPRTVVLRFAGARLGDQVHVDPDDEIAEIAEHNNFLTLGPAALRRDDRHD